MKNFSWLLSLLLILTPIAHGFGQSVKDVEQIKKEVARLGVGSKAKVTITRHDGTKVKGYVHSTGDDEFIIRDRKTDTPTTVHYTDVYKVDDNRSDRSSLVMALGLSAAAIVTIALLFGRRD
ncbi:MAG TPA: hypothetical protein VE961_06260 [Pyrinomonadaceae bacterium]|nr:hypothetical protein [Pyrinomonadaceae bacterium]